MTAAAIRQSFLNFFREKQHTIVPSASLLPQSPGLLFTNAGMNPFVPYFLGVEKAPYHPPRAADTQKCIRAGGKHNDLEDVGYDTYHHTFFEMLGNWSFGNYFKQEAIAWAWELVVERWGLPATRLYASVYGPKPGDPGEFDRESWDLWAALFRSKGCDPAIHIVHGSVKDNFWMMGETGPCGPCSELHVDLTPEGDSQGKLVNNDSDLCIEIWNLVFIQYNAEADGTFRELPAKHVDTGMGFERACSIIQGTKGFTDFSTKPSNYATDVFQPLFRKLEELSGRTYVNIYPQPGADRALFGDELKTAIAFRVVADHLRTLSFSIADGIMPGNNGRNYVLRRILRRAVRYGRQLGFSGDKPFFGALVATLVTQMGEVFPELLARRDAIRQTLQQEEASFNQTLDRGLKRFEEAVQDLPRGAHASSVPGSASCGTSLRAPEQPVPSPPPHPTRPLPRHSPKGPVTPNAISPTSSVPGASTSSPSVPRITWYSRNPPAKLFWTPSSISTAHATSCLQRWSCPTTRIFSSSPSRRHTMPGDFRSSGLLANCCILSSHSPPRQSINNSAVPVPSGKRNPMTASSARMRIWVRSSTTLSPIRRGPA